MKRKERLRKQSSTEHDSKFHPVTLDKLQCVNALESVVSVSFLSNDSFPFLKKKGKEKKNEKVTFLLLGMSTQRCLSFTSKIDRF